MGSVTNLPVWKKNASAEDWFHELAQIARSHPEYFEKVVLAVEYDTGKGTDVDDVYCHNCNTTEAVGILELAKMQLYDRTRKRP